MGKLMNIIKSDYIGVIDMGVAGKFAKIILGQIMSFSKNDLETIKSKFN